ncbi:MAG TPA: DUF1361 domain-containing protein [Chroococcidiopsis sp.]
MIIKLLEWLGLAKRILLINWRWMAWNTFLAVIPLGLSYWLFRGDRPRSALWWVVFLAFVAFLPNAPYVLTDIIHLVYDIRSEHSIWVITLVLVPQYLVFMLVGFGAYTLSLVRLGNYLIAQGMRRWVLFSELFLHSLSAIGVYLGRFERFNSWDFVTKPHTVLDSTIDNLVAKRPVMVMTISLLVITCLYWLMKQVTVSLMLRRRYAIELQDQALGAQDSQ